MPLIWCDEIQNFANACAACGHWPVTTFNDRCLTCHELALLPPTQLVDQRSDGA